MKQNFAISLPSAFWTPMLLLLCVPWVAASGAPTPVGPCVPVVSTFPRSADREFHKELQRLAAEAPEGRRVEFPFIITLGDASAEGRLREELRGRKPTAMIYLDSSSYRLLPPEMGVPSFCLLPSADQLLNAPQEPVGEGKRNNPTIIEILPTAGDVANAIRRLSPAPRQIGLVYSVQMPWNERFLRELQEADLPISVEKSPFFQCKLDPGACRNLTDVQYAIERDLDGLTTSGLVLVLPDVNTLKFAFCMTQYASARNLGMIGLGDFRPDTALVNIRRSPQRLAQMCHSAVEPLAFGEKPRESSFAALPPEVEFSAERLAALGYRLTSKTEGERNAHP